MAEEWRVAQRPQALRASWPALPAWPGGQPAAAGRRARAGAPRRTCVDIHAKVAPGAVLQRVLLAQLVEHVGGVEAGVVAQLPRDDLQCLGERVDEELRLARDGARVVAQLPARPRAPGV